MKSDIENMEAQYIAAIDRQEDAINQTMSELTQIILYLQNLLDYNDFSALSLNTHTGQMHSGTCLHSFK